MHETRTVRIETVVIPSDGFRIAPVSRACERTIWMPDGGVVYVVNPPQIRRWGGHGDLLSATEPEWQLALDGEVATIRCSVAGAECELLHLGREAAAAFESDAPEPMVTVPAFEPFGGIADLGKYYLADRILTGVGHKRRVDSTGLSLYRIARRRGGALWDGVADLLATAIAERLKSARGGSLPHDLLDRGETHVRYLNDSLLLMVAQAEWHGGALWSRGIEQAVGLLDAFTVSYGDGLWVLHDSLERDEGRNDLVLNTQIQAIVALKAAGADTTRHERALQVALANRASGARALRAAAGIGAVEAARAFASARLARRLGSPYIYAGRLCRDHQALRLPGGWIARDLSGAPAPSYYATVNLVDLGGLIANRPAHAADFRRWLDRGVRFALASGFFRAETRSMATLAPLIPLGLRLAGRPRQANVHARRQRAAGGSPVIGWPGYEDDLWSRLVAGTP